MNDKKFITRFFVSTAAAFAFAAVQSSGTETAQSVRPMLTLTSGDVVDPATAPEVTKYSSATAREFAERVFGGAEETPDLNEFFVQIYMFCLREKMSADFAQMHKRPRQSGKSDRHLSGDVPGNGSAVFDAS